MFPLLSLSCAPLRGREPAAWFLISHFVCFWEWETSSHCLAPSLVVFEPSLWSRQDLGCPLLWWLVLSQLLFPLLFSSLMSPRELQGTAFLQTFLFLTLCLQPTTFQTQWKFFPRLASEFETNLYWRSKIQPDINHHRCVCVEGNVIEPGETWIARIPARSIFFLALLFYCILDYLLTIVCIGGLNIWCW